MSLILIAKNNIYSDLNTELSRMLTQNISFKDILYAVTEVHREPHKYLHLMNF